MEFGTTILRDTDLYAANTISTSSNTSNNNGDAGRPLSVVNRGETYLRLKIVALFSRTCKHKPGSETGSFGVGIKVRKAVKTTGFVIIATYHVLTMDRRTISRLIKHIIKISRVLFCTRRVFLRHSGIPRNQPLP